MKIIKGLVYTDKQYIEILENRINKAIEYINYAIEDTDIAEVINTDELLKILKGE